MAKEQQPKKRVSLKTPVGVACFVNLLEPKVIGGEKGKNKKKDPVYSLVLVFGKDKNKEIEKLQQKCIEVANEKFGEDDVQEMLEDNKLSLPFRRSREYKKYGEPFVSGGYMVQLKSNKDNPPGIVDASAQDITDKKEVYAGMKARASYGMWAFDTDGNKGVTLLLNNVQKAGDGKRLSGKMDASEEFDELEPEDDDDDDGLLD